MCVEDLYTDVIVSQHRHERRSPFAKRSKMSDTAVVEMERPSNVDVGANERVRRDEDVDEAVVL